MQKLIIVTPTYDRPLRLAYLKRCLAIFQKQSNVLWFVVEDGDRLDPRVVDLLKNSRIKSRYEHCGPSRHYGNAQRDYALQCLKSESLEGIVYLADDDNGYDPRLFQEIRKTKRFSIFPVGNLGPSGIERPMVVDGKIVGWAAGWMERKFPVDTASFAFNAEVLKEKDGRLWPNLPYGGESEFVEQFATEDRPLEVLCNQARSCYVWHNRPLFRTLGVKTLTGCPRCLAKLFLLPRRIFVFFLKQVRGRNQSGKWFQNRGIQKRLLYEVSLIPLSYNLRLNRNLSGLFHPILGCPFSGTDVLYHELTSRSRFAGLDQHDSNYALYSRWPVLLFNRLNGAHTAYELPMQTTDLKWFETFFPRMGTLWVIRSPYDVISAMKAFMTSSGTNWIQTYARDELMKLRPHLPEIGELDYQGLPEAALGTYVWKFQNEMIRNYEKKRIRLIVVRYEDLVGNPAGTLADVFRFCGVPAGPVIRHRKVQAPAENSSRDDGSMGPCSPLTNAEREQIRGICGNVMREFGYV